MRKALGILMMVVGVPMLMGSLFLVAVGSWAFNKDFYKSMATDKDLYAFIKSGDAFVSSQGSIEMGSVKMDPDAFSKAFGTMFPEEPVKAFAVKEIDNVFSVLDKGMTRDTRLTVNLVPLKTAFASNSGVFAKTYLAALKPDPERKVESLSAYMEKLDFSYIPSNLKSETIERPLTQIVRASIESVPSTWEGGEIIDSGDRIDIDRTFKSMGDLRTGSRSWMYFPLVFSGIFWLIAGLIFSREWDEKAIFLGSTLGLSSALVLFTGIVTKIAVNVPAIASMARVPELSAWLATPAGTNLQAFVTRHVGTIANGFFITGVIAMSVAVAVTSLKWISSKREI